MRTVPPQNWYNDNTDTVLFISSVSVSPVPIELTVGLLLAFGVSLLPGLVAFWCWRGPCVEVEARPTPPRISLQEAAVLRDGAMGSTRWAYAALLIKLARDGHCILVRTQKRRWLRTGPTVTVDLHADPQTLTPFEQAALRQLGRHDTLGGFGFAGSTFRRRTLRDVRANLVDRGWLADHRRGSNVCVALGLVLMGVGIFGPLGGLGLFFGAASAGGGVGSLIAAGVRYPITEAGAQRRAAHRAYAEAQRGRVRTHLSAHPDRAVEILIDALPALVLERIATPHWLDAVADRLAAADGALDAPDWIREETDELASAADACRSLGDVLRNIGARTPLTHRGSSGRL